MGSRSAASRPTGIYGLAHPASASKWYHLVETVASGRAVDCRRGGKEVHAADVARAVELLLRAQPQEIAGEAFNCCDRYISEYEVALIAEGLSKTGAEIRGELMSPKNQIVTMKLASLGMSFGGHPLLEQTIAQMIAAMKTNA